MHLWFPVIQVDNIAMRKIIYILLIYFSILNLIAVSGAHVHHDAVMHAIHLSDECDDGSPGAGGNDEKENISEHLYEHGCIIFSGGPPVKPVPGWFAVEFELSQTALFVCSRNAAPSFPESNAPCLSPCPVSFRLRAPPSFV
jgi:hypothetical protein